MISSTNTKSINSILPSPDKILKLINLDFSQLLKLPPRIRSHYLAAINFLTEDKLQNSSKLEQVAGLIEAFYHFCELQEWEIANQIIFIQLNTETQETLHQQLETWGYYQQQKKLYERMLEYLDSNSPLYAEILSNLGTTYFNLKKFTESNNTYQKVLDLKLTSDKITQGFAFRGLGNIALINQKYGTANNYYQQALTIAQQNSDQYLLAKVTQNIGNLHQSLQDFAKAIQSYQFSLAIYEEINNYRGQATCLLNIGKNYSFLQQYDLAINNYQKSWYFFNQISDLRGEKAVKFELGFISEIVGKFIPAQSLYQESISLSLPTEELQLDDLDAVSLNNLANVCYHSGYLRKAAKYYQKYLIKMQPSGFTGNIYNNLGAVYYYLSEFDNSLACFQKALNCYYQLFNNSHENINNSQLLNFQSDTLCNLGLIFNKLGDYNQAIRYSQQALASYEQLPREYIKQKKQGQANTWGNLGISYRELQEYNLAFEYLTKSYNLAEAINDKICAGVQLREIGITYQKVGNVNQALENLHHSWQILSVNTCLPEEYETLIIISQIYQENQDEDQAIKHNTLAQKIAKVFENC